jgi:hypothetical protein
VRFRNLTLAVALAFAAIPNASASWRDSYWPFPSLWKGESSPPEPHTESAQQPSAIDQRGTEQSPLTVKVLPTPKTDEEAAQARDERDQKSSTDRWMIFLTAAVATATFLQVFALWVTIRTARRQLRAYVFIDTGTIRNVADPTIPNPPGQVPPNGAIIWRDTGPIAILVAKRPFRKVLSGRGRCDSREVAETTLDSPCGPRPLESSIAARHSVTKAI